MTLEFVGALGPYKGGDPYSGVQTELSKHHCCPAHRLVMEVPTRYPLENELLWLLDGDCLGHHDLSSVHMAEAPRISALLCSPSCGPSKPVPLIAWPLAASSVTVHV